MLRAVVLLCLAAASHQLEITDFAVPSVVKSGENVELQCRYRLSPGETRGGLFFVKWWRLLYSGERQLLYQRLSNFKPQLQHLKKWDIERHAKPNDTIELLALQPRDSGKYICEVSNLKNSASSAKQEDRRDNDIVVYTPGSGPKLSIEAESNATADEAKVLVQCHATDVAPKPTLVITVNSKVIDAPATKVDQTEDSRYNILVETAVPRGDIVDTRVKCELFYDDRNIVHEPYTAVSEYYSEVAETDEAEALEATVAAVEVNTTAHIDSRTDAETDSAVSVTSCVIVVALATALRLVL